jgi:uncharacterized protein (DUF4213/DUF364 family)
VASERLLLTTHGFIIKLVKIIDDLLTAAHSASHDYPVQEVLIGLHWTAVQSLYLGLAATQADESCCFVEDIRGAGYLHEKSAYELAEYMRSSRPLEASVGMAALNSFLPVDEQNTVELNARDLLIQKSQGRKVALVGHFQFTEEIRRAAAQLWVLELNPTPGDLPAVDAPQYLPQVDVIGITATTLLNGTFEDLARLFPDQALIVMLGPSTPLSTVLFDYGVDVLAGARVNEPGVILRHIAQSSPLHRPKGLQRLTLARDHLLAEN